MSIPQEG